jgi:hypothetical protein
MDFLQWFTEKYIYFFEILIGDNNESNKDDFLLLLEQCLCSVKNNIPMERTALEIKSPSMKYINFMGVIKDLHTHANKMSKKLDQFNKKHLFEEKKAENLQEMKNFLPKLDDILNLEEIKKVFSARGEIYHYDMKTDELIELYNNKKLLLTVYRLGNNKYDCVLCIETMNQLLVSIDKITEEIKKQIMNAKNSTFLCWITSKCYKNIVGNCLGFLFDNNEDKEQLRKIFGKFNYYELNNKRTYYNVYENKNNNKILENSKHSNKNNKNFFSLDNEEKKEEEE